MGWLADEYHKGAAAVRGVRTAVVNDVHKVGQSIDHAANTIRTDVSAGVAKASSSIRRVEDTAEHLASRTVQTVRADAAAVDRAVGHTITTVRDDVNKVTGVVSSVVTTVAHDAQGLAGAVVSGAQGLADFLPMIAAAAALFAVYQLTRGDGK